MNEQYFSAISKIIFILIIQSKTESEAFCRPGFAKFFPSQNAAGNNQTILCILKRFRFIVVRLVLRQDSLSPASLDRHAVAALTRRDVVDISALMKK